MINTIQNKHSLVALCRRMHTFCMSVLIICIGACSLSYFTNQLNGLIGPLTVIAFIVTSYFYGWTFLMYIALFPSRNQVVDLRQHYTAIQPTQVGHLHLKIKNQFTDLTFTQHPSLIIH